MLSFIYTGQVDLKEFNLFFLLPIFTNHILTNYTGQVNIEDGQVDALLKILSDFQIAGAEEVVQTTRLEETSREPDGIQSNRFNEGKSLSGPDNEMAFGGMRSRV